MPKDVSRGDARAPVARSEGEILTTKDSPGKNSSDSWALAFALFLGGFLLLVLASKWNLPGYRGIVLKTGGALSCVAGLLLSARRRRRVRRTP